MKKAWEDLRQEAAVIAKLKRKYEVKSMNIGRSSL